jgi:hypothetical protein
MTNPKYGAIKTNVVPKKNTGLYFGFIVGETLIKLSAFHKRSS